MFDHPCIDDVFGDEWPDNREGTHRPAQRLRATKRGSAELQGRAQAATARRLANHSGVDALAFRRPASHDAAMIDGSLRTQERDDLRRGARSQQITIPKVASTEISVGDVPASVIGATIDHKVLSVRNDNLLEEIAKLQAELVPVDVQYPDGTRLVLASLGLLILFMVAGIFLVNFSISPIVYAFPMFLSALFLLSNILLSIKIRKARPR